MEKKCKFFGRIICVYQKFIVPLQQKNRHQNRDRIGPKIGTKSNLKSDLKSVHDKRAEKGKIPMKMTSEQHILTCI